MQQTLLALLALLVATFLSFNQKQADLQNQSQVVQGEIEQMAVGVAAESMEIIRSRAFDAATDTSDGIVPRDSLTTIEDTGNRCKVFFSGEPECSAIEDFHGMDPAKVSLEYPEGQFQFEIKSINVAYVDKSFDSSSSKTYQKKITIKIQDVPSDGGDPRLTTPIEYSEVVSYP